MPHSNLDSIYMLQKALNTKKGMKILFNRSQFFSEEQQRPVTIYKISQAVWDPERKRNNHKELFTAASQIQIVLFLRNLWKLVNDEPVPLTNKLGGAEDFEAKWAKFEAEWRLSNNINAHKSKGG